MITCLKYLVPISCFLFLGATVWPLALLMSDMGQTTVYAEPLGKRAAWSWTAGVEGDSNDEAEWNESVSLEAEAPDISESSEVELSFGRHDSLTNKNVEFQLQSGSSEQTALAASSEVRQ